MDIEGVLFSPDGQQIIVPYSDGKIVTIDINWLNALPEDLSNLTQSELVEAACYPYINGLFDGSQLEAYMNGREPQACQP